MVNVPEKDRIVFEEEMVIDKLINKEPANWVDQVEMIGETGEPMNWVDQVEKLWEAGELVMTSEWKPGDKEFKSSGCPHPKCIVNGAGQARKGLNHHVITSHLPWFAYPCNTCWQCHQPICQQSRFDHHVQQNEDCSGGEFRDIYFQEWVGLVNQMLWYITEKLKLPAVSSLLEFIRADPALYPKNNKTFTSDLQQLMEDFEQANGIDHQSRDYQMLPPNCIAAVLHWRTLFNLISLLNKDDQKSIQNINTTCNLLGEPVCSGVVHNADEQSASLDFTSPPKIADAHLHLDLMFQRMQVSSWEDAATKFHHPEEEIPLEVIIPCYAFPSMYPQQSDLMKLPPLAQNVQVGFHLRSAAKEFPRLFPQFQKLANSPQVAAIG